MILRSLNKFLLAAFLLCALSPQAQDADTNKPDKPAAEKPAADAPLTDAATPLDEQPKVEKTVRAENDEIDWVKPKRPRRVPREHHEPVIRIRGDVVVKEGETVGDIVVIAGTLKMDGEVRGSIVSIASETSINGHVRDGIVVVPGPVEIGPKADIGHDAVVVGSYKLDPDAKFDRGFHPVVIPEMVPFIGGVKDFLFQGLLMMRPLPPHVRWVWWVHGGMLLALIGLTLLFPSPVRVGSKAIGERPVLSLFSGFLTIILFLPVLALLSVTVIGIPVTLIGIMLAALFGKASLMTFIGQQIGRNLSLSFLESPLIAMLMGSLILMGLYMVPVVGLLTWGIATLLGVGAIMVATAAALNNRPTEPTPITYAPGTEPTIPPIATVTPTAPLVATSAILHRVGFWKRTVATLLDLILLAFPMIVSHGFAPLIMIAYFVGMWTWKGTTIGMICLGLKIVRTDGSEIDFAVALVRSLAACFSFVVFLLGFFWAGWDRQKQSWHDKIAGTIIIQVPKGVSLL